jgi:hypothetical protein
MDQKEQRNERKDNPYNVMNQTHQEERTHQKTGSEPPESWGRTVFLLLCTDQSSSLGQKGAECEGRDQKGTDGETITITEPSKVQEYIQEVWSKHFEAQPQQASTLAVEWIGQGKCIKGETDSLMRRIDIEELQEMIKNISNNKAPGPTEETIEMIKWMY